MSINKTKATRRFTFEVNRNFTSKRAGSNTFTISTNADTDKYSSPTASLSMTVKEAKALQGFLNETLADSSDSTVSI